MLTTIWRSLQSHSNRFTKPSSPQRKRQRRQSDSFRPCETLEKRQFLSANTIGYTGDVVESLIGTSYITQPGAYTATQATDTIVLSDGNSFLSSSGVQAGTVGTEQLSTVEVAQDVQVYQVGPSIIISKDGSTLSANVLTSISDASEYNAGIESTATTQIYTTETINGLSLLDLSREQTLNSIHSALVSARDSAQVTFDGLVDPGTQFIVDAAESSLNIAQFELDVFCLVTGFGVTYAQQIDLYESLGSPFFDHSSDVLQVDYNFAETHNGLLIRQTDSASWVQASQGIRVDGSVTYGEGVDEANPLTASSNLNAILADVVAGVVGVQGVFMPSAPSFFEADGMTTESIALASFRLLQAVGISRPELARTTTIDLGYHGNGPAPLSIELTGETITRSVSGIPDDTQTYVISNVANGVVEKLTDAGWVDVTSPPASTTPMGLLKALQLRKIKSSDQLRWKQIASENTATRSINLVGWNKDNSRNGNSSITVIGAGPSSGNKADDTVNDLNEAIKGSGDFNTKTGSRTPDARYADSYSEAMDAGYGVIVRQLNDGQDPFTLMNTKQVFLAASLIHNDLNVPNSVYPYLGAGTGTNIMQNNVNSLTGQWTTPTLVATYNIDPTNSSHTTFSDVWYDEATRHGQSQNGFVDAKMSNAKDIGWGWGVLYPHDSNSEQRAIPIFQTWNTTSDEVQLEQNGSSSWVPPGNLSLNSLASYDAPQGRSDPWAWKYDAPGGDLDASDIVNGPVPFAQDTSPFSNWGANDKWVGNPLAHLNGASNTGPVFGAGAGIHVQQNFYGAVQSGATQQFSLNEAENTNSWLLLKAKNLVSDPYGQINYDLKNVDDWAFLKDQLTALYNTFGFEGRQWLYDLLMPWANNPRDMINISNMIWEHQNEILGDATAAGLDPITANNYWGWNEVPIPGNLQFPTAGATTKDVGVYPLGYGWTDQAISNSSTITLSDYKNDEIYGFDRIEPGLKVSFLGAPHNLVVVSDPSYNTAGDGTRTVTFDVNANVTIPAKTMLTFKGQVPPAISSLAFVLPQQTDDTSVPTGNFTSLFEYKIWAYHNSKDYLL